MICLFELIKQRDRNNKMFNYKAFVYSKRLYGNIEYFSEQYELVVNLPEGMLISFGKEKVNKIILIEFGVKRIFNRL